MLNSIESIRNYVRLTPNIGTAGQPREEQFIAIAEEGFATVINIAMPDHPDSIDHEGRLVSELDMLYIHLPVPFEAPRADHVRQFCKILKAREDNPVFIHCIMNYRVSAFMYHYLTAVKGVSATDARSPIFDLWQIEPAWQEIMQLDKSEIELTG